MTAETGSYRWMAPEVRGVALRLRPQARKHRPLDRKIALAWSSRPYSPVQQAAALQPPHLPPPSQVIRHEPYGTGCDVYSFGVLCWEMLSYSIPFPQHSPVEVALSVATKGKRPEIPAHSPSELVDLIEQCWQQEALLRPSFAKVRRAPRRAAAVLSPPFMLAARLAPTPSASPPAPRLAPTPPRSRAISAPALLEPWLRRPRSQVCSSIDAIEGTTASRELPGAEAVLNSERQVAGYGSFSVETLRVTGSEGQASPPSGPASRTASPAAPLSGCASPGEKRKCSDAWSDRQEDRQMRGDTRNTDCQKPSESSHQPGATVIVANMGATATETSTPQSPHGSPKGANLKWEDASGLKSRGEAVDFVEI